MTLPVSPATQAAAITPTDTAATVFHRTRGVWGGTGGDLVVAFAEGGTVTLANVPNGSLLPISIIRVAVTNTTADDLIALY